MLAGGALSEAAARGFAALAIAYALGTFASLAAYWVEPAFIDDDARMHLLGFYALRLPDAFADRFLSDYAHGYVPTGYRILFGAIAPVLDPLLASKALGAVLLVVTWIFAWRIGRRLGELVGAAAGLGLCVHSTFILVHTFGGLHRGFGYPLLFAFVWAWLERRDVLIAWILFGQALFYPPVFLVCWTASAIRLVAHAREFLVSRRRGLVAFIGASVLSAAVLIVFSRTPDEWGPLATAAEAAAMGEFRRDVGRFQLLPFVPAPVEVALSAERALVGTESASADGLGLDLGASAYLMLAFVALVLPALFVRPWPAWVPTLFFSALAVHEIAQRVAFRLGEPDRALKFAVPVLVILAWPLAWGAAGRLSDRRIALAWRTGLVAILGVVLGTHGLGPAAVTDLVVDARDERPLHHAITELDTSRGPLLITGWPGEPIDNVPLLAGREVFVDFEHAHPLYLDYYAEVRRRIEETLALYYAVDVDTARDIRDRNGLTHLIVERGTLDDGADRPKLFRPLDTSACRLDEANPPERRIFRDPPEEWIAYRDARFDLIDLRPLRDEPRWPDTSPVLSAPIPFHSSTAILGRE